MIPKAPNFTEFRKNLKYFFDTSEKFPINIRRSEKVFVLMSRDYYAKLINRINGAISAEELKNIHTFVRIRTESLGGDLPTL